MLDETEHYADLLTSDAAVSCFSEEDANEAALSAEKLKMEFALGKAVQQEIFTRVSMLKKRKFTGSKVPFPELPSTWDPEDLVKKMPAGAKLELDKFNGRWLCTWRAPTKALKQLSRSWGMRGHRACIVEIMDWVWGLAIGYGEECPYQWPLQKPSSAGPAAAPTETPNSGGAASSAGPAPAAQPTKKKESGQSKSLNSGFIVQRMQAYHLHAVSLQQSLFSGAGCAPPLPLQVECLAQY